MNRSLTCIALAVLLGCASQRGATAAESAIKKDPAPPHSAARVYGEWRIHVRPDKVNEYAQLIESKGLPLFRAAGGRMVGWWTTLVGDLYEHLTIWEYDNMAAFEQAVQKLGHEKAFAEFVALRDPLLAGEENRFLQLSEFASAPALPEPSNYVIHEVHRIPPARKDAYLKFMQSEGLPLLKRYGFRPVGPWIVNVGNGSEVSYLFRYDSLREREDLIASFLGQADARDYNGKVNEFAQEITTRILVPAPFAPRSAPPKP